MRSPRRSLSNKSGSGHSLRMASKLDVVQRNQAHPRIVGIGAEALGVAGFGFMDDDRMQAHVGFAVLHLGRSIWRSMRTKNRRENCSALGETGSRIQRSEKR